MTEDATAPAEPAIPKLDKKKSLIAGAITLVTLVIVFAGILPKLGNYSQAWDSVEAMNTGDKVALIAAIIVNLWVYVFPLMAAIPGLKYRPAFVVRQTSFTISNAVPAGGAVGLGVQYAMLAGYKVSSAAAATGIAITSVWSVFMTLGLPVLGVVLLFVAGDDPQQYLTAAVVGVVSIVAAVVIFALILRSEELARRIGGIGQKIIDPFLHRFHKQYDLVQEVVDFRAQIVGVVSKHWIWITTSNFGMVLGQFLILLVAIRAVSDGRSAALTTVEAFAAFAISRLGTMIPLTPGGLGTVDAALTALLVGFGMQQNDALAATLVWRACSWVPQVFLGVGTFLWWRRNAHRHVAQA
ncbi:MAG TPA: lysylphosphatidylglycerol synthase transmembrane domain-containing protein [Actinomycetota bacterium]|nr:lysylphosphatidylglycerol synthase transmembrane domain-containing protein [Actinomycetota bacterium]